MPQTVWDYVAKLKTSVTKASSIYSIFLFVLFNYVENILTSYIFSCFCFLLIRSYV